VQQALALEVADILPAAGEEAEILDAFERRADIGVYGSHRGL